MLYNVLLALDLCNQLFSIITLMNLGHTWLFRKSFCTVFFSDNEQKTAILPHSAQINHDFLVNMKENSKSQKWIPEIFFRIIASEIRTMTHKVATGWR